MISLKNNFDISDISFIKVGGIVKEYIESDNLYEILKYLKNKNFIAISNTSKILFAFDYLDKSIVKFKKNDFINFKDTFFAYSGISLNKLYQYSLKYHFSGFEKIATIPGLLGGSLVNNASFLKQEISQHLKRVLLYYNNKLVFFNKNELDFSYRHSSLNKENLLIVGAEFYKIHKDRLDLIREYNEALKYRKDKQNHFKNTLGSTFKNQNNLIIGKVIDELGLKGYKISQNVYVSNKHGNFIIIKEKTIYKEIIDLITFLKDVLYNYLGVEIYLEINIISWNGKSG